MVSLRPVVLLLALGPWGLAAPIDEDPAYQAGLRALQDELPAVAAARFEETLAKLKPDDPARATLHLRLAESRVRAGEPAAAFEHLEEKVLQDSDEARLWAARAFVALGRFGDATDALATLAEAKDPDLRHAAALARAHLFAALGNSGEALPLFEKLAAVPDPEIAEDARLLHAAVLLDGDDPAGAATVLQGLAPDRPSRQKRLRFLQARLAFQCDEFESAAAIYEELANNPEHLNLALHHSAAVGHADALHALGRNDQAVEGLLGLLDDRPDTPLLDAVFSRLTAWASANDTLRDLLVGRLQGWSSPGTTQSYPELLAAGDPVARALAADTPAPEHANLAAHALYHRARILAEKNDTASVALALRLLGLLRLEHADHDLAQLSLLETARLQQAESRPAEALAALTALGDLTASPDLKAEAARLAGRIRFDSGEFDGAAADFARARRFLDKDAADLAAMNHALCLLQAGDEAGFGELLGALQDDSAKRSLQLEQALLLAYRNDAAAAAALDRFLRENGGHPRLAEARLALAEISASAEPRDLEMARAQLDSVDPARLSDELALRHLLTRLKLAELTGDWQDAIADANRYLQARETPEDSGVLLKLAEAYYLNGDSNLAQLHFLNIVNREKEGRLHDVAAFFAAKSALKVGTPPAITEAVELLAKLAAGDGLLADEARLHLSRAYLDGGRAEEALKQLAPLLERDSSDASHLDALLLSAEAQRAMGSDEHLEMALEIYDRLLARKDLPYPLNNRIHFLKGLALEQLDRPEDAFATYYRVIDGENLPKGQAVTEWKWFYDCGFKCLRLLGDDNRWRAAYNVARKLAATEGPRAGEAGDRARKIQLKHMIWEDE
ncbi:MAG: tetratricopeptide repeat protein [Akkermansiaceae bacterium]|nr:tetratricopeptide repeat protein [Akkermansiaceae bacterium]